MASLGDRPSHLIWSTVPDKWPSHFEIARGLLSTLTIVSLGHLVRLSANVQCDGFADRCTAHWDKLG